MQYLTHSPADILRDLLIDLALATDPEDVDAWPVHVGSEPFDPDNCITVYDTEGKGAGRSQIDGALLRFFGLQIRIRSVDHLTGWTKGDAIQRELAESVYQDVVTIGASSYLVHAINNIGNVLVLGKDPGSKRNLFTLNATMSVKQI